jgi:hypothetical protein
MKRPLPRLPAAGRFAVLCAVWFSTTAAAQANYSCTGQVTYLGVGSEGDVIVSLSNPTPRHYICSMAAQGTYRMTVAACKAVYATLVTAKLSNKSVSIFYRPNEMTCETLSSWAAVPSAYFVQGPD